MFSIIAVIFYYSNFISGLRIIFFLPYIWQFQRDGRLKFPSVPYIWHLLNTVIIAIKAIDNFVDDNQDSYQWFFLLFSSASILFQVHIYQLHYNVEL